MVLLSDDVALSDVMFEDVMFDVDDMLLVSELVSVPVESGTS
jgi:hypothetical protein